MTKQGDAVFRINQMANQLDDEMGHRRQLVLLADKVSTFQFHVGKYGVAIQSKDKVG